MSDFRFDPIKHEYWYGTRRLLGTTEVIKAAGLIYNGASDERLEEGRIVHECCALLAKNNLDWNTVDDRIVGWVRSYEKLLDHTKWVANAVEVSLFDPLLGFAGTFDCDFENENLFDIKTGVKSKWHKLQTAAYAKLHGSKPKRGTLYLREDGELPKIEYHYDSTDWPAFLTCLNWVRVKEQYGN